VASGAIVAAVTFVAFTVIRGGVKIGPRAEYAGFLKNVIPERRIGFPEEIGGALVGRQQEGAPFLAAVALAVALAEQSARGQSGKNLPGNQLP
jgi:hypothetical protein